MLVVCGVTYVSCVWKISKDMFLSMMYYGEYGVRTVTFFEQWYTMGDVGNIMPLLPSIWSTSCQLSLLQCLISNTMCNMDITLVAFVS
uniref:Uncharacterized protein n=1 Tax=Arion vulgaris TaxID=1028688 RepID=A0A0B7B7N7_9EUPU